MSVARWSMLVLAWALGVPACGDDGSGGETGPSTSAMGTTGATSGPATTSAASQGSDGSTSGVGSSSGVEGTSTGPHDEALVLGYCECMIINCHDPFHDLWGEEDFEATMNCRTDAGMLPQLGEETEEGPWLECRIAACIAAQMDETQCEAALGAAPCTE